MRAAVLVICVALASLAGAAAAQQASQPLPILIIDYDRLYVDSIYAQQIRDALDDDAEALKAENDRIVAALTDEERSLTLRRPTMSASAFRSEAEAFDTKVQAIRRARDAKEIALQRARSAAREEFFVSVRDAVGQLMLERGASVILDRRSVFLALAASDITDEAIARIDAVMLESGQAPDADQPLIGGTDPQMSQSDDAEATPAIPLNP